MAFEGLSEKLNAAFRRLRGKGRITEADVREAMKEVRLALLDADDVWVGHKLERQAQIIREHADICFLGAQAPLKILLRKRRGLYLL